VDAAVTAQLSRLDVPTLLVVGALDAKYVALGERMAAALPRARLAVVPGAGHAVHLERPDAFGALVAEFLAPAGTG
jgi:pimeloyl-ACP methyl ester carboxylesterase